MDSTMQGCFRNAETPSIKSESEGPKPKPDIKASESESSPPSVTPAELYGCLCHQRVTTAEMPAVFEVRFDRHTHDKKMRRDALDKLIGVAN